MQPQKSKWFEITPQDRLFSIYLEHLCDEWWHYVIAQLCVQAQQNQGEQMQPPGSQTGALVQHKLLS